MYGLFQRKYSMWKYNIVGIQTILRSFTTNHKFENVHENWNCDMIMVYCNLLKRHFFIKVSDLNSQFQIVKFAFKYK